MFHRTGASRFKLSDSRAGAPIHIDHRRQPQWKKLPCAGARRPRAASRPKRVLYRHRPAERRRDAPPHRAPSARARPPVPDRRRAAGTAARAPAVGGSGWSCGHRLPDAVDFQPDGGRTRRPGNHGAHLRSGRGAGCGAIQRVRGQRRGGFGAGADGSGWPPFSRPARLDQPDHGARRRYDPDDGRGLPVAGEMSMAINVYFDDIKVGDQIPAWSRKSDFMNWNRYAAVNDEFIYSRIDAEAGRAGGNEQGAFGMVNLRFGYMLNALRDGLGDEAEI